MNYSPWSKTPHTSEYKTTPCVMIFLLMCVHLTAQIYAYRHRELSNFKHLDSFNIKHKLLQTHGIRRECRSIQTALDYNGTLALGTLRIGTFSRMLPCLPWSYNNINEESNYCRNINADKQGPWCYLAGKTWKGYCDIPYCKDCYIPFNDTMRKECKSTRAGLIYNGTVSISAEGNSCLPWLCSSNINEESNYCRNIDADIRGPWCYVSHKGSKIKQHCDIHYCSDVKIDNKECKSTRRGIEYAGTMAQTAGGKQCLKWPQDMHSFQFPDYNITLANNYCRNVWPEELEADVGPWCYTTIKQRETQASCDIPYCSNLTVDKEECRRTADGFDYAGTMSTTIEGYQCQKWSERRTPFYYNFDFPENNVTAASRQK